MMRFWNSPFDKPLFSYPGISILQYELIKKEPSRKLVFGTSSGTNAFFGDWARVFTGHGKGQYECFSASDVEQMEITRARFYDDLPFLLVSIRFKRFGFPIFFGRRGGEKFGIPFEKETELEMLKKWLTTNHVEVVWEPTAGNHLRS